LNRIHSELSIEIHPNHVADAGNPSDVRAIGGQGDFREPAHQQASCTMSEQEFIGAVGGSGGNSAFWHAARIGNSA